MSFIGVSNPNNQFVLHGKGIEVIWSKVIVFGGDFTGYIHGR
jgi:hypothetical protein